MSILELLGFVFEWHDDKFELVHKKRGISLEEVASVFFDDNILDDEDIGDYGEQRFVSLGMSNKNRLLAVVWTERDHTIRIITAYFPSKHQEKEYNNATRY